MHRNPPIILVLAPLLLGIEIQFAEAGPIHPYRVTHALDTFNAFNEALSSPGARSTPIEYDFGPAQTAQNFFGVNIQTVRAHSSTGSVGIFAQNRYAGFIDPIFGPQGPIQRMQVFAFFTFDVVFSAPGVAPGTPLSVTMNLDLSGEFGGENFSSTGIQLDAAGQRGSIFIDDELGVGLLSNFGANGSRQTVRVANIAVGANRTERLTFGLTTVNPADLDDQISFENSLSFTTTGDVFEVFDGNGNRLSNAIVQAEEANIFNNQFNPEQTNVVPEPTALMLLTCGVACLCAFGWCSQRRKTLLREVVA